jgi:hypothetical protein
VVIKPGTLRDVVGAFVRNRLPDLVDLAMVVLIIGALGLALLTRSMMLTDHAMVGSIVAAALCFLLASRSLRRCEGIGYERIFVAACAMAGGVMLFEMFYHLGSPDSWKIIGQSLTTFGLDLPRRGYAFSVLWAVLLFSTVFVGARHMRVNRWILAVAALAAVWFLLWLAVGFPSYGEPRRWPEGAVLIQLIPPQYAHPRDPSYPGWPVVSAWGALFSTVAKLLIGVLPAAFFMHHLGRPGAGGGASPDDVLARAWDAAVSRLRRKTPVSRPEGRGVQGRFGRAVSPLAATVGRPLRRALEFLSPKLADIADLAMVGVILVSAAIALLRQSFVLTGSLLAGSLIGFALCYLIASRGLRRRKELGFQRAFISLCAMVSSMWLFEIIFHYWGWNAFNHFFEGFTAFNLSAPWLPFPLLWSLIMVSLVLVGARYTKPNRFFIVALAVAVAMFWMWKSAGFPTFNHPALWPQSAPLLPLIPLGYAHAPTPEAAATISFWGGFFNTAAKIAWCVVPGTLFLTRENLGGPIRGRLWPPGPALKGLLFPWIQWRMPTGPAEARARSNEPGGQADSACGASGANLGPVLRWCRTASVTWWGGKVESACPPVSVA